MVHSERMLWEHMLGMYIGTDMLWINTAWKAVDGAME